jgi:uncharacterized protein YjbJ (UPF0337 family)
MQVVGQMIGDEGLVQEGKQEERKAEAECVSDMNGID